MTLALSLVRNATGIFPSFGALSGRPAGAAAAAWRAGEKTASQPSAPAPWIIVLRLSIRILLDAIVPAQARSAAALVACTNRTLLAGANCGSGQPARGPPTSWARNAPGVKPVRRL